MIYKGCTCKNIFPFPYSQEEVATLYITYQQKEETILEKELKDCEFYEGKIIVFLSQEETLKFEDNVVIEVQIRVRLNDDTATKSNIMKTYTNKTLKKGVI